MSKTGEGVELGDVGRAPSDLKLDEICKQAQLDCEAGTFNVEPLSARQPGDVLEEELRPGRSESPGAALLEGWRKKSSSVSLEECNSTLPVPSTDAAWYRQWSAYIGVGFMVSVGYMDPGNWATNIAGGAAFGYTLLIVILLSSFTAMFLQCLSLKLGVVTDRDLAQACRDSYHPKVVYGLWFIMEVAIAATDLAEVIGSAVALNLLFHIPIWAGVIITGADVLFIIIFGTKSFRFLEVLIMCLCAVISGCFAYELGVVKPNWGEVGKGFIPKPQIITDRNILYAAIGILGATVMPHNLFLHSSLVQTRQYPRTPAGRKVAIKYGQIDSNVSLSFAFFVNAAMLIMAAAVFHYGRHQNREVADITTAYKLLAPAVGDSVAPKLFAVALLCSGQQSTITGTLSGQIVMEGFLDLKMPPWARRMLTRLIAIVPAVVVAAVMGDAGVGMLLVLSQVILSMALSFAVVPLVHFTSTPSKMRGFVNAWWVRIIGWILALIIAGLNAYLVVSSITAGQFTSASSA